MDEDMTDIKMKFNLQRMCRSCLKESEEDEMSEIFDNISGTENLKLQQILLSLTSSIQVISDTYCTIRL